MEKRFGSSAGFLALLAVLIHTFGNSGAEHGKNSTESKVSAARSESATPQPELPTGNRQGPWRATQQYFHNTPTSATQKDEACLSRPNEKCIRSALLSLYGFPADFPKRSIRALIATVPDPLHTRMALETDRYLDAIQQAAFQAGWELATQWVPWTVKAEADQKSESGDASSHFFDVEKLPGLLVFRPHFVPYTNIDQLLLVFVVGETPTAGVNGFQFQLARQTVTRLGSDQPDTVLISGPNFSGSLFPLARLLEESPGNTHFEIHSGSVSNSDYARAMLLELQSKGFLINTRRKDAPSATFHGSTLPSVSFHHHFVRLVRTFGLKPQQAAELVEDETGFSYTDPDQHLDIDNFPIVTYRYPRDIAQLRNVYNDAAFAGSAASSEAKTAPGVEFSLKDTQSGEDTFPIFSSSHTAVSQDAELQQLVGFLNRRSVRLVSLSATNVFDTLFLANVITRQCPDTRIVLQGPDLLFVQESGQGSLSGIMAISPFPLFPEGAEWSRASQIGTASLSKARRTNNNKRSEDSADVLTFATSDQIGEFDAMSSLLLPSDQAKAVRQPFEASFSPAAMFSSWVLVLGPGGWLPVDLYGQTQQSLQLNNAVSTWFDPAETPPHAKKFPTPLPPAKLAWTALCLVTTVSTFAFCGWLFYLKLDSRKLVWSSLCLSDLGYGKRVSAIADIVHSRYLCMLSCFASLALMNGLLLCPMWAAHYSYGGSVAPDLETLATLAFVASMGTAIYLAAIVPARVCRQEPLGTCPVNTPVSIWSLVLRCGILVLSAGAIYVWWCCCNNGIPGYLLCFRTLTLAAPVCPIWPLLLTAFALFALAFFHLRRFTWGDRRQPHLETSLFDEALCNEFSNLKAQLDRELLRPFSAAALPGVPLLTLAAVLIIIFLWILFPAESLTSFEPSGFSHLLGALLLPLGVFTMLTFVRFVRCWRLLRAFLVSLNSVVLGRFFMRIPEFSGSGPVWIREVKLMSLATVVNSAIALHNLEKTLPTCSFTAQYVSKLRNLLSPGDGKGTRLDFIYAYAEFRRKAAEITQTLGNTVFRAYWRKNKLPFVGTGAAELAESSTSPESESAPEVATAAAAASGGKPAQAGTIKAELSKIEASLPNLSTTSIAAEHGSKVQDEISNVTREAYEYAGKYVALQYSVYIGYVLHQLQNLLLCSIVCFVLVVAALNSFSFQAPGAMFRFLMAALAVSAVAVLMVLAQMERDPILSRLSGTPEGVLGKDFYIRALAYGALPILTVLSTQFPAISRFVSAWVQPAAAGLR
jgi:hypothetical protein